MAFHPGIQNINELVATQAFNSSIVPVDVTGFSTAIAAGKSLYWEVNAVFSTGATGGFRFLSHSTSAPTTYNAVFHIIDITTAAPAGTPYNTAQVAEAAFTNASAVATNYSLEAWGKVTANLLTTFSFQFAQNNSTVNNISMLAGATMKTWLL